MPETSPHAEPEKHPKSKGQPLYLKLYFDPAYTELTRFIGYGGRPLAEAQAFVLELREKYGREKVIEASEAISTCEGKTENLTVRLRTEARRLAWQLLGPPPQFQAPLADAFVTKPSSPKRNRHDKRTKEKLAASEAAIPHRDIKNPAPGEKPEVPDFPPELPSPLRESARTPEPATSLLQQYREAKQRHPDRLLLFRVADFYELFEADAVTASKALGLTLTTRDRTVSMAGFPHHSLEKNLRMLLEAGHRVAICDQVNESTENVRQNVQRVLTRGMPGGGEPASLNSETTSQKSDSPTSEEPLCPDSLPTPAPQSHVRTRSTARKPKGGRQR